MDSVGAHGRDGARPSRRYPDPGQDGASPSQGSSHGSAAPPAMTMVALIRFIRLIRGQAVCSFLSFPRPSIIHVHLCSSVVLNSYEHGEKSSESATLSAEHPLSRVFTIADCNGFRVSIRTVGGHLGDRLGAGVGRVGRGDGTIRRWDLPVGMMASGRRGGQRAAGRNPSGQQTVTQARRTTVGMRKPHLFRPYRA